MSYTPRRWFVFHLLDIYVALKPGLRVYIGTPLFSVAFMWKSQAFDISAMVTSIEFGFLMKFWMMESDYIYRRRWEKRFDVQPVN